MSAPVLPTRCPVDVDTLAPTVVISDDEPGTANIAGGDITYTFQFSETVTGFDTSDVTVANGTDGAFFAGGEWRHLYAGGDA